MSESSYSEKARQIRDAFDRSFALPVHSQVSEVENVVIVHVAAESYAIKLREIAGLAAGKKVLSVRSSFNAFLGLAGVKGVLVPVWSLAILLGYGVAPSKVHWMVQGAGPFPWALAFDALEGYARVPKSDFYPTASGSVQARHVPETCRANAATLPVVSLPSLRDAIQGYFNLPHKGENRDL